jgi:hypothetical protein
MTRSQAQRIQEIIRSQDVRDPRETLDAISAVINEVPSILPSVEQVRDMLRAFENDVKTITGIPEAKPEEVIRALCGDVREINKVLEGEKKSPLEEFIDALRKDTEAEVPHLVPDDPKNEFGNPVAVLRIYNSPSSPGELKVAVALECCDKHIQPRHILAAIRTLHQFAEKKNKENAE